MSTTEHRDINISQMFYIHVKEAHCCCVVVVFCGVWDADHQRCGDRTQTRWHMYICTLKHSHALYLAALIMVSLEVSEEVQRNHFSFKKIFFSFPAFSRWFIRHYYYRINPRLSLLHYCRLSVFLPPSHLSEVLFFSEVMKKSHLSCGYCSKSSISTVGLDNWVIRWCNQTFPLVHTSVASSLCCHSRGPNKCRWTV